MFGKRANFGAVGRVKGKVENRVFLGDRIRNIRIHDVGHGRSEREGAGKLGFE
jgi:hypothetical protein